MKKYYLIVALLIAGFFVIQGSLIERGDYQAGFKYPKAIRQIIDIKCYGCHSVKGKSQDAKDALMWDSLPNLKTRELVATLDDIIHVLEDNEMPPAEFLKKYPEAKLLPKEREMLMSWAEAKADSIMK
jgi:hypothetical protein